MYMQARVRDYCSYSYQPPQTVPEIIPNPDRPAVPTRCKMQMRMRVGEQARVRYGYLPPYMPGFVN
jgi:hypothetical protein